LPVVPRHEPQHELPAGLQDLAGKPHEAVDERAELAGQQRLLLRLMLFTPAAVLQPTF
jgi:hypothetical protein